MARKKKRRKSVVPLKLQIPLAVVLGIVFIIVLNTRLRGGRSAEGRPAPTAPDEVVTADVAPGDSERRVDALIDKITREEPKHEREDEVLPRLAGDPFAKPKRRHIDSEHVQRAQDDDAYAGQSRQQFLESLTLRATLIDGDKRLALINDTLYGENDTIGAFKIVEIRERCAALNDDSAAVLLEMKGDDPL